MITVTERAAVKIKKHLENRGKGLGILVGVNTTGCSGLAYKLEYVDDLPNTGEFMTFTSNDILIVVSQRDLSYLDGLTMEWKREGLKEGFDFVNPNEKARCGCGESFTI